MLPRGRRVETIQQNAACHQYTRKHADQLLTEIWVVVWNTSMSYPRRGKGVENTEESIANNNNGEELRGKKVL